MTAIGALLLANLPSIVAAIKALTGVQDAGQQLADLISTYREIKGYLEQNEPLTPAQKDQLKADVAAMATAPEQQITD